MEELTLVYQRERVRFPESDVAILECQPAEQPGEVNNIGIRATTLVKAECSRDELVVGLSYRFYGHWRNHQRYGRQFHAITFVRDQPHGRAGVIRYLMQAPHIGQQTATKLWDKFGSDAVRILRDQPEVAATAVERLGETKASESSLWLREQSKLEKTTIDLMDTLAGRGFPRQLAKKLVQEWGNRAAEMIRRSPYLLMRFRGCGFLATDQLYLDMGGQVAALKRQTLAAWYAIARDTNGHTWYPTQMIEDGIRERVGASELRPVEAVRLGLRAKLLSVRRDTKGLWVAERRKANSEEVVARRVRQWLTEPPRWPDIGDLEVSEHQREKLRAALASPLAIFSGGPGTGKTYTAARLIERIIAEQGSESVAVAAPTGKAAVRITEVMQGYGIAIRARTIHSLLGVEQVSEGEGWTFRHNGESPLPWRFLVVDEASMVDTGLAASLCRACPPGMNVLLVGDTGQLPPVGHGAPLRDLIAAGVPNGELTEIRRNAGRIVLACHEIRQGRSFRCSHQLQPAKGENLQLVPASTGESALELIVEKLRGIAARGLANPIWGCQVIVAVNARSPLSRQQVNVRLQEELNATGQQLDGHPFRVGDKIVCLKNSWVQVVADAPEGFNDEVRDGKVYVANGEQAEVKLIESRQTIAQLDSPLRLVRVHHGTNSNTNSEEPASGESDGANSDQSFTTGCSWDLAYAISCHKSQGSEWPVVLVALDEYPGARLVCSREWIYTAISRAKQVGFLVGKMGTAQAMVMRQAIGRRKTFLSELIQSRE